MDSGSTLIDLKYLFILHKLGFQLIKPQKQDFSKLENWG